jgi:phosphotransferase system  glucose/maltose/N-acetylglucosamine-specific IIC component
MQDATTQSDLHSLHGSGDLPPITSEPTEPLANTSAAHDEPAGTLKGEPPVRGARSPLPPSGTGSGHHAFLPQRGLSYAFIAGSIAGVVTALLTMVVTLINAGTFHAASQQIAVDRLTVTTGSLVISFLLLCLWSIGGGLVSQSGTWVATVRHPHYLKPGE